MLLISDLPPKRGQTLVISGGGRGIGYEAVKKFLGLGYHVILGKSVKLNLYLSNSMEWFFQADLNTVWSL